MRSRDLTALALTLAALGCVPTSDVPLPLVAGAKSLIFAAESPAGLVVDAYDLQRGDYEHALAVAPGARLTAVFYDATLSELSLEPGAITEDRAGVRAIPTHVPHHAFDTVVVAGDGASWRALEELVDATAAFRFAGRTIAQCLLEPGCLTTEAAEVGMCPADCAVPDEPLPPVAPQRPAFLPCPAGWSVLSATGPEDVDTCAPPPVPRNVACDASDVGLAQLPLDGACTPLFSACPTGEWPASLPPGRPVVYVRAGAAAGGTGSVAAPFARITDALLAASSGAVVAIARGRYSEALRVDRDVSLVGACVAETTLGSAEAGAVAAIHVVGGRVAVEGLRLNGAGAGLVVDAAVPAAEVELHEVLVDSGTAGIALSGAVLAADTLVVRGGEGISARGSTLSLARVVVDDVRGSGISVTAGSRAQLVEVAVRRTHAPAEGFAGIVVDSATVTVARSVVETDVGTGIVVAAGALRVEDSTIRSPTLTTELGAGRGLEVRCSEGVVIVRSAIEAARTCVVEQSSRLELDHVVLTGGTGDDQGSASAVARFLDDPACPVRSPSFVARHLRAEALAGTALHLGGDGEDVLEDLVLHASNARSSIGLLLTSGAVTLRRVLVVGVRSSGLFAQKNVGRALSLDVADATFVATGAVEEPAVKVSFVDAVRVERLAVLGSGGEGLRIEDVPATGLGPVVEVSDVFVRDAASDAIAANNLRLHLERVGLELRARRGFFLHTNTELTAEDVTVTRRSGAESGVGLACVGNFGGDLCSASLDGFRLTGNGDDVGVEVSASAIVRLHDGVIEDHRTGAVVVTTMQPLEALAGEGTVLFRRNETALLVQTEE